MSNMIDKIIQEKGYYRLQKMFRIIKMTDTPGVNYDPEGVVVLSSQILHHVTDLPSIKIIMELNRGCAISLGSRADSNNISHLLLVERIQ